MNILSPNTLGTQVAPLELSISILLAVWGIETPDSRLRGLEPNFKAPGDPSEPLSLPLTNHREVPHISATGHCPGVTRSPAPAPLAVCWYSGQLWNGNSTHVPQARAPLGSPAPQQQTPVLLLPPISCLYPVSTGVRSHPSDSLKLGVCACVGSGGDLELIHKLWSFLVREIQQRAEDVAATRATRGGCDLGRDREPRAVTIKL